MGFLTKLFKIISGKKYRKSPSAAATDPAERRALQAGLINSEQIMAYCDSYATGLTADELVEGLGTHWDVSSPQEAVETLGWLGRYGHRFFYDIVFRVYSDGQSEGAFDAVYEALVASGRYGDPDTVRAKIASEEASEEKDLMFAALQTSMAMLEHLKSVFRVLKDDVNGTYEPKDYSDGILAWDLGRRVTVARMAHDCGYIEDDELRRILAQVDSELRQKFSSWPQFAKSYIIGRASWSGQTMMLGGIISIAQGLMTDKDSPWVLAPL